jgi:predicted extracellular nuclease
VGGPSPQALAGGRKLKSGVAGILLLGVASFAAPSTVAESVRRLEFLGEAILPADLDFEGTRVGGLSGLAYDSENDLFYAVSDDPALAAPARLYSLTIDLGDGHLDSGDVVLQGVTRLLDLDGSPFAPYSLDGEGIALSPGGGYFISSEGNVDRSVDPFLREFVHDGAPVRSLMLPKRFLPRREGRRGVRHNLAFESLTLSPDGRFLFTATENALSQDGPVADLEQGSPARILRYDPASGKRLAEYLYQVEPVAEPPASEEGFQVNGLVELLALDGDHLVALERAYSQGVGNTIRLFLVDLSAASDVRKKGLGRRSQKVRAADKTLLLDLADLDLKLENLEGLSFGRPLEDGRRTLLLVSDNNFSQRQQTQFLAFAWSDEPPTIAEIQGRGHVSPLEGAWVREVTGVVTAVDHRQGRSGFWLQTRHADDDPATSEALFVAVSELPEELLPGTRVGVGGRVEESGNPPRLTTTRLLARQLEILGGQDPLPLPVTLGKNARLIPSRTIDDDGFERFEPETDAADSLESLEGMRIAIEDAFVVGPTNRYGEFVVLAGEEPDAADRTSSGGILVRKDQFHPQRLIVSSTLLSETPQVPVGARFEGLIVGVLAYGFGSFRLQATEPLPALRSPAARPDNTPVVRGDRILTVATFNVENLDALDPEEKLARTARIVVENLGSPDILALQEVQDDSGPEDDGAVSAQRTLLRLTEAIITAGGPFYEFRQIDPLDNQDGGQPGGNIRVAFLFDPQRVSCTDRGQAGPGDAVRALRDEQGPYLSPNPGRVSPTDPSFSQAPDLGYSKSRKPLALELLFGNRRLFLVNLHLRSKGGDDPLFGSRQPPFRPSEIQRSHQARIVSAFVEELLALDPEAAIVILGDFNEHPFRQPLEELTGRSLTNLIARVDAADRYTYIYRGNSQVLDYILVSPWLASQTAPEIDVVHVNADFPAGARASDHDPVIASFRFAE